MPTCGRQNLILFSVEPSLRWRNCENGRLRSLIAAHTNLAAWTVKRRPLSVPLRPPPMLGAPIYGHPVDIDCLGNGGVCQSPFKQDAHARFKPFAETGSLATQALHGLHLQKWRHLPARRRTRELEEPTASRQFARLLFAIFVPPRIGVRLCRRQPSTPRKPIPALIVIRCHPMFGRKMIGKTPKPPPTKQTFDRLAAEIALNLVACSKTWRLFRWH